MRTLWIVIILLAVAINNHVAGQTAGLTNIKSPSKLLAILNVNKGETCSGEITLKVRVPDQGTEGERLTVYVGDQVCSSAAYNATLTSQGFITSVSVPTDAYANGWHDLTLCSQGLRTHLRVKFTNDISEIQMADLANPFALITAKNTTMQPWTVKIISTESNQATV